MKMYCKREQETLQCKNEIIIEKLKYIKFYKHKCKNYIHKQINKQIYETIRNDKNLSKEEFADLLELMKYIYDKLKDKEKFFVAIIANLKRTVL